MIFFVVHDNFGVIAQVGASSEEAFYASDMPMIPAGSMILEIAEEPADKIAFLASHFVRNGELAQRGTMTPAVSKTTLTADGVDIAAIRGLPTPSAVTISGLVSAEVTVTDGTLDITADQPGAIVVTVNCAPEWLPWSITLNAA